MLHKHMKLVAYCCVCYGRLWRPTAHWRPLLPPAVWRAAVLPLPALRAPCRQYAKKAKKKGGGASSLSEEERDVIDLARVETSMQAAITALKWEYSNSLVTRLTPASLDKVYVEMDGQNVPLRQLAQVGMPNPSTLMLNFSSYPQAIDMAVNALRSHVLSLNPIVEKNVIKVPIPKMSRELRERMAKQAKAHAEKAKVGIRKARQKAVSDVRKENVSEDATRKIEKHIQELTDASTESVDELLKVKSKELLSGS